MVAHIVIAVINRQLDIAVRMQTFTDFLGNRDHVAFAFFKIITVKITDDIVHFRAFNRTFDALQMIEPLIPFGIFRRFFRR